MVAATVVVVDEAVALGVVVRAGGAVVVLATCGVVVVVVAAATGFVRPVHGVDGLPPAFADEDATIAAGTVTVVVVVPLVVALLSGLRSASGCSAIVPAGVAADVPSSVSSGAISLALVRCGSPNDGAAAWSSWPRSSVVSAVRPANAAMGAITTAAKHPRPLAGSSR